VIPLLVVLCSACVLVVICTVSFLAEIHLRKAREFKREMMPLTRETELASLEHICRILQSVGPVSGELQIYADPRTKTINFRLDNRPHPVPAPIMPSPIVLPPSYGPLSAGQSPVIFLEPTGNSYKRVL